MHNTSEASRQRVVRRRVDNDASSLGRYRHAEAVVIERRTQSAGVSALIAATTQNATLVESAYAITLKNNRIISNLRTSRSHKI